MCTVTENGSYAFVANQDIRHVVDNRILLYVSRSCDYSRVMPSAVKSQATKCQQLI